MSESVKLSIHRPWQLALMGKKIDIYLNDDKVGSLGSKDDLNLEVSPAVYQLTCGVKSRRSNVLELEAKPDNPLSFECGSTFDNRIYGVILCMSSIMLLFFLLQPFLQPSIWSLLPHILSILTFFIAMFIIKQHFQHWGTQSVYVKSIVAQNDRVVTIPYKEKSSLIIFLNNLSQGVRKTGYLVTLLTLIITLTSILLIIFKAH